MKGAWGSGSACVEELDARIRCVLIRVCLLCRCLLHVRGRGALIVTRAERMPFLPLGERFPMRVPARTVEVGWFLASCARVCTARCSFRLKDGRMGAALRALTAERCEAVRELQVRALGQKRTYRNSAPCFRGKEIWRSRKRKQPEIENNRHSLSSVIALRFHRASF